ncbi:hypothetical protein RHECNPAF_1360053 [Rhizobium etli CNPAF512]|nr:hypothetical protein RHECNPAF_1360053 [Rhizobium etli CNPAF512]
MEPSPDLGRIGQTKAIGVVGGGKKQSALLVERELGGDRAVHLIDLVERSMQTGDREVAGKHRTFRAETSEAMLDHRPQAFERPRMVIGDKVGDLQAQVRLFAERPQAAAPERHAVLRPVGRAAAVIENEKRLRKRPHQIERLVHLPGIEHQVEDQSEPRGMGKPGAPGAIAHAIRTRCKTLRRIGMPAQNIADADHAGVFRFRLEQARGIRPVERNAGDITAGYAGTAVEAVQPAALFQRVGNRPAGLHMHRRNDVLSRGIGAIIVDAVITQDRSEVSHHHLVAGFARFLKPGMALQAEVPEVVVRVDHRPVIALGHRRASRPETSSRARISVPNMIERQPGEALTTVISAVVVTSRIAPGMVPA